MGRCTRNCVSGRETHTKSHAESQGDCYIKTDGGWINVSEAARIYGKSRKWVYDQIKRYQIGTEKTENQTRLRLVDLIAHRGEPQNGAPGNTETHTEQSQKITPEIIPHTQYSTPETELLKQENQFLRRRIEELEADKAERQVREAQWNDERPRLQGIIERQTYALPKPQSGRGLYRFVQWVQGR